MAYADIRAEIKTILESVDGVGKVHEFLRHLVFWEKYFEETADKGQLNVWEITRDAAAQEIDAVDNLVGVEPFFRDTHNVLIIGRIALKDENETELDFQDLCDAIVVAFRLNNTLNGKVLIPKVLQVPVIETRMYGPVLTHYTEMRYEAIERVGG